MRHFVVYILYYANKKNYGYYIEAVGVEFNATKDHLGLMGTAFEFGGVR